MNDNEPDGVGPGMGRTAWAWLRLLGGAAILGVIVWQLGTGPIVDGIRHVSIQSVLAALAITAVTTAASAYRWRIVATGIGVGVAWPTAVAAYYRSQFLNTALPGGILGDAHRAVRHGQDVGDVGRAARAVGWERAAGQVVQAVLAIVVLAVFPSPVRHVLPIAVGVLVAAGILVAVLVRVAPRTIRRVVRADVRDGLWAQRRWVGIAATSAVVVAGHTAIFVVAARTVGVDVSLIRLLPLAIVVLLAMSVPTSIGGWGPREGAAAWLFGAAGLGAAHGVAVSTVYGVIGLIASLPGAVVLVIARRRRGTLPTSDGAQSDRRPVEALRG